MTLKCFKYTETLLCKKMNIIKENEYYQCDKVYTRTFQKLL